MVVNGAVAKIALAVALGGSAGAISYVTLQHASNDQVAVSAPAAGAAEFAIVPAPTAEPAVEHHGAKSVANGQPRHKAKRHQIVAVAACSVKANHRSKAKAGACRLEVAAHARNRAPKVLGYTKAMATEPLPVQSVEVQHVDGPLSTKSSEIFKPVTDVMP